MFFFFFSSRRRHTRCSRDWSSDVCSSDLVAVIIWTTTPWTLPASMAVAFHPDFEYVAAEAADGQVYIIESRRLGPVQAEAGLGPLKPLARFRGKQLERVEMQHPFLERKVLGVLADY